MLKRTLGLLLVMVLLVGAGFAGKVSPYPASIMQDSVVKLERYVDDVGTYTCTGFSISPRKYLTAQHCVRIPENMFGQKAEGTVLRVDGHASLVLKEDEAKDLALILADLEKPSVKFRQTKPGWLEVVYGMGYGMGVTHPIVTEHQVELLKFSILPDAYPGTLYNHPFIGGMSGGPVFDKNGEVVGIIQRADESVGYGVDNEAIQEFLNEAEGGK